MLVVAVVALAAVLGLVMLSTATLANRSGANQGRLTSAEYLAQSGVNIAMYYLQYPDRAPAAQNTVDGYWGGTGGDLEISPSVQGTVNVTITRDSSNPWVYEVISTGTAGVQDDTQISRSTGARVLVRQSWDVKYGAAFNVDTSLNAGVNVSGDAYTSGNLVLKGGLGFAPASVVSGVGHCSGHQGTIGNPGKWDILTSPTPGAPLVTDIFNYKTGYKWAGGSYNADVIDAATTSSWTAYSPTASVSNPAHIFYVRDSSLGASGTFTLNSNVVINGTLIVDGNLNVRGSGITITPVTSAYPALIVTGTMDIAQKKKDITVNGTCYIGTQLKSTTIQSPLSWTEYSKLTVNGGLMIGANSGSPLPFLYNIATQVNYNAASPPAPIQLKVPKGLTVLRWGLPYTSD